MIFLSRAYVLIMLSRSHSEMTRTKATYAINYRGVALAMNLGFINYELNTGSWIGMTEHQGTYPRKMIL